MVFESIVADVLNRFLGDYIENLDHKQLKLGIWGGDIVLKDLHLKQNALKDLDLPIQTVYGRLQELVVKIPWQNLYGASVEVSINGLYLLIMPNNQVEYNAEKEEERAFNHKKSELQRIEDMKKLQELKPPADDTFVEKLVTQIIKNVQLSIKNIHVRYEDKSVTRPFAMGLTLSNLIVQTTTEDWKPTVVHEMVKQIYKIVTLEGAAVYWNCGTEMFSDVSQNERNDVFQRDIADKSTKPPHYKYILGPINSEARLVLNPKPEHNEPPFALPKAHAELKIELLSLGISMCQYRDIINFADTMRMQTIGLPYRKYRPHVPYKGHAHEWWFFAYTCIMETDIKRRKRNWDWNHMCDHRQTCKRYGELYKVKLSQKKIPTEVEHELGECERKLDLYNLVLIRQRIAMEVEMLDKMRKEKQPKGWFSGWFGGGKQAEDDEETQNYLKRFQEAMTPEEKKKLFAAIDYSENAAPTPYPASYVDTMVKFHLEEFKFNIRNDETNVKSVVKLRLMDVQTSIERRPKNNGLRVTGFIADLLVTGLEQNDVLPEIISSKMQHRGKQQCLVDMMFEMNPIDMNNGNRIRLSANPLKVVYDAETINQIVEVFTIPSSHSLDELSHVTAMQLNSMKEKSALGLQSVIEKHTKLDIHVRFSAPVILVPHGGLYTGGENVIVVNLGTLIVKSLVNQDIKAVQDMIKSGFAKADVMNQMILQSYDRFRIELTSIQVLVAQSDEKWIDDLLKGTVSPMHILCPINLSVLLETCIIHDDPNLPLTKVSAEVPKFALNITDARLMLVLNLVQSLMAKLDRKTVELTRTSSMTSLKVLEKQLQKVDFNVEKPQSTVPAAGQMTLARIKFELQEFSVNFSHQNTISEPEINVLDFSLRSLTCGFLEKTYVRTVSAGLGAIEMIQFYKGNRISVISTTGEESPKGLFTMEFMQVNKKCPDFETLYNRTLTSLSVDFAILEVTLHHDALVDLIRYQTEIQAVWDDHEVAPELRVRRGSSSSVGSIVKTAVTSAVNTKKSDKKTMSNDIAFKLNANLEKIGIHVISSHPLSEISIAGLNADVQLKDECTHIISSLRDITILDKNPKSLYGIIMSVDQMQKAIEVEITIFNDPPPEAADIDIRASLGRLRVSFLFWYLTNMLNFVNSFQKARETIVAASQKAAQTAKQQMEHLYARATKIKFDVKLKAPEIMIPEKSSSLNALLIDLGHITLSNEFHLLAAANENGDNAVVDKMQLKLEDLKIDSVILNKNIVILERVSILQPLSFILEVNRNLSAWFTSIPSLDVNGILDHIHVQLGQNDYGVIMKIISENMTEGRIDVYDDAPAVMQDQVQMTDSGIISAIESNVTQGAVPLDGDETFISTNIRWNFAMHSFKINLFNVTSTIADTVKTRIGLGELAMEGFLAKGRIMSNNSITNSLLLMNVVLNDTRPNREGKITELLSRTPLSGNEVVSAESRNMVDMTFQTKKNDTFVDLRVYSFTFLLSVEYLLKLASFFQGAVVENSKPVTKKSTATVEKRKVEQASETNGLFSIALKLEKPDIILVENIDDLNTRALILNCELLMKFRMIGPKQTINGTLSDLQMYTCMFNPAIRNSTKNMFLDPLTLSIAGSTPENKGLHVEIMVTRIYVSVSVYTIELLNNILKTISAPGDKHEAQEEDLADMSTLWDLRHNRDNQFWFLESDTGEDAMTFNFQANRRPKKKVLNEMCIVHVPEIVITLQAGIGHKTYPILAIESQFRGKATNWSSQLYLDATLGLQMGYYNNLLALWEPLIEPVTLGTDSTNMKVVPWEINLEVNMNEQQEEPKETDDSDVVDCTPQPAMTVDISSSNNLELTVTKTGLEVVSNLGNLFAAAATVDSVDLKQREDSPGLYRIVNTTGTDVVIDLNETELTFKDNVNTTEIILKENGEVYLDPKVDGVLKTKSFCSYNSELREKYLNVTLPKLETKLRLPYLRAVSRYFRIPEPANAPAASKGQWGLVSNVAVVNGITVITLCSILEVFNCFNVPIDIYFMRNSGNELECIATINPGTSLHLPLHAVYSPTSELFFSVEGYSVTTTPYLWRDLQLDVVVSKNLICSSKADEKPPFVIKVIGEMKQIYYQNTVKHTMSSTMYQINLRPAVLFKNCLPFDVTLSVAEPNGIVIKPGDTLELPNVEPGSSDIVITLPNYLDKDWACSHEIAAVPPQFSVWTFDNHDSIVKMSLDLGVHCLNDNGSYNMSLYCPFWMINKSDLDLSYRKSKKTEKNDNSGSPSKATDENSNVLYHPAHLKQPILFSFNAKNFFGKKKACVKIGQGDWCDKFSIDVAGSAGVITCKENDKLYELGVKNTLTHNGLTKMITFAPYYVIINQSNFPIECQEDKRPADPWLLAEPKSCIAFWPVSQMEDKLIRVRMKDTEEITIPFLITESHTTLLKLKNKFGGINVDIQLTEGAVYINLTLYDNGMAPALIINSTPHTLNIWEKKSVHIHKLLPEHNMFFTWDYPSSDRVLVWEGGYKAELEDELRMDGGGHYAVTNDTQVYWISFLDGMQRVLLFTSDAAVAANAQSSKQVEVIDREVTLSLNGVGLSIVNNLKRQEIVYIGIASTGIIWETRKRSNKRYKQMNTKDNIALEEAYQQYLLKSDESEASVGMEVYNVGNMEVNFRTLEMTRPHKREINRRFQTGIWLQMKTSQHQMQLHVKINRLQIDNQLYDCTFPVLLAPVPPPKSIVVTDANKPFAELSIVQLLIKNSQIQQYKYFKVLIQEFHIKVDLGFVNAIMEVFDTSAKTEEEEKRNFLTDIESVFDPLYSQVTLISQAEQKSFYDSLHFSPLKIHISFSMSSGQGTGMGNIPVFLAVLLQGIGVTLTDLQDVVFKLAYFEREYSFLTQKQLMTQATKHYVGQTVKQLYVLVLGLDVIGNPYGLVLGITKGVEDLFYEPFQGAIQGPGEFAEGLVLGVASLFGHTFGGAAGAVSRITGAMGKGIAALSFDKEYQRKRRDQINKRPATVKEGLARGGKGLVMGVVDGVTGVFTKPISGAKEQGIGGFFKGLGKGAVGLVARPTAGVMDFASSSLDSVKRATEFGGAYVTRLRPARFVQGDRLVKPYNPVLAHGNKLLCELEKGKYHSTDIYSNHFTIIDKKEVLLLSDKRLSYVTHNDLFGGWQVDWTHTWQEMEKEPVLHPKGVQVFFDAAKKSRFKSNDSGKIILLTNASLCEQIVQEITHHIHAHSRSEKYLDNNVGTES